MSRKPLSPNAINIIEAWLGGETQTNAWLKFNPGEWEAGAARTYASQFFHGKAVANYIRDRLDEQSPDDVALGIKRSSGDVLAELTCIAFADPGKMYKDGVLQQLDKWPLSLRKAIG